MVMMYLLGVMLVLKEINIYVAVGFLLLYLIYVILVVCQSNGPARDNNKKSEVSEL
jgi:Ca2+/Na+ antiporter